MKLNVEMATKTKRPKVNIPLIIDIHSTDLTCILYKRKKTEAANHRKKKEIQKYELGKLQRNAQIEEK